jgi:DNA-directed RNA polymerase specialized sigma24 family protein
MIFPMSGDGSVTRCIAELKAGEDAAAERLWQAYFQRLVGLARAKLGPRARPLADEEDVALSAFKSLCLGAVRGRFPQLRDRGNLWPLLVVLTARKAQDLVKYETREKRGGGRGDGRLQGDGNIEAILSREPPPEFSAMMAENCAQLLDRLQPAERQIALLRLEGYTNTEIAARLGCALRTVERRLELIRRIWDPNQ